MRDHDAFAAWQIDPARAGGWSTSPGRAGGRPAAAAERVAAPGWSTSSCGAGHTAASGRPRPAGGQRAHRHDRLVASAGLRRGGRGRSRRGWSVPPPGPRLSPSWSNAVDWRLSSTRRPGSSRIWPRPTGWRPHRHRHRHPRACRPPIRGARPGRAVGGGAHASGAALPRGIRDPQRFSAVEDGQLLELAEGRLSVTDTTVDALRRRQSTRVQHLTVALRVAEPQSIPSELSRLVGLYSLTWSQFYYTVPTMPGDVLLILYMTSFSHRATSK